MWTDLLLTLGALTIGGAAAVILFALTARLSRTRYAARWRCWIWVLLCLRLVIPFSFFTLEGTTHQAPIQIAVPSDPIIFEQEPQPGTLPTPDIQEDPPVSAVPTPPQPTPGVQKDPQPSAPVTADPGPGFTLSLSQVLGTVWLAGMGVMVIWTLISHLRFLRYVRRWSRPAEDPSAIRLYNQLGDQMGLDSRPALRLCPGLRAPMLAGLLRPILLLPEDVQGGDTLRFVLIHELTHYKRRDILLKTLALLANIVHWFNPFMWYMVRLVERDTELACDEAALRRLPAGDHAAYGRTILNAVERLKKAPNP